MEIVDIMEEANGSHRHDRDRKKEPSRERGDDSGTSSMGEESSDDKSSRRK